MLQPHRARLTQMAPRIAVALVAVLAWVLPAQGATTIAAQAAATRCSVKDPTCYVWVSGTLTSTMHQNTAFVDEHHDPQGDVAEDSSTRLDAVLTVSLNGRLSTHGTVPATYSVRVSYSHSDLFHSKIVLRCRNDQHSTLHTWGSESTATGQAKYGDTADVHVPVSSRNGFYVSALLKAGVPTLRSVTRNINDNALPCPEDKTPHPTPSPFTVSQPSLFGMQGHAHNSTMPAGDSVGLSGMDTGILPPLFSREKGASTLTFEWQVHVRFVEALAPLTEPKKH